MRSPRVLVIEDDPSVRDVLCLALTEDGYTAEAVGDGFVGLNKILEGGYDLVLLDLQLPGMNGLEVCRRVRRELPALPLILLTSKDSELDRVLGLELGADDYVTKPFYTRELLARVRTRLRIAALPAAEGGATAAVNTNASTIVAGDLSIDLAGRVVTVKSQKIALTNREFDVLVALAQHPGRAFSRENILEAVWGTTTEAYLDNVSALISRLRKKLEPDATEFIYIQTVHGFGYRFAPLDELENADN